MQVERYLKLHQPIIYRTFVRALDTKHLSHAYLISGAPGTPLLQTATFLAKSILCDEPDPLACNSCITCLRVEDENYPDFIVYNGEKETIKKEMVSDIESRFEKKAFESKGIMIYILHLVENMTIEAINAILKFLEEPGSEIYAFLTTNNENNVLPTIISRCQLLRIKNTPRNEVIESAISYGVEKDDAELLSRFYNDGELISDLINNDDERKNFEVAKTALTDLLDVLANNSDKQAIYYSQKNIIPIVKTKESARFFLDMLADAFEDILNIQQKTENTLKSYEEILNTLASKLSHVDEKLINILKNRNLINTNVNIALLMDHVIFDIIEEN